jgi:hypothetical protein
VSVLKAKGERGEQSCMQTVKPSFNFKSKTLGYADGEAKPSNESSSWSLRSKRLSTAGSGINLYD